MSGFTPLTFAQLQALWVSAYAAAAARPANTDAGSSMGAVGNATSLEAALVQNQSLYTQQILRLANIPPLLDGSPNPDVDSFWAPFNIPRLGPSYATGDVTCSTPSPVGSQIVVPAGGVIAVPSGVQYAIQPGGSGYSSTLGGYPINAGQSSVTVPVTCLTAGILGNALVNTQFAAVGGTTNPLPPAITTITNAVAFTNGLNTESDANYKARGTITVSSGRTGTGNAQIAAGLAVQAGLTYSYGDRVNADGSTHDAYETFFFNVAGSGVAPSAALISSIQSAIDAVRGGGISFQVLAPTLQPVDATATIVPVAAYTDAQVLPVAIASYNAYVNGIGLAPDTSDTTCSLAQAYAAILNNSEINGVPCVKDVQGLTLNGGSVDLTRPFGYQFVAGIVTFTGA